MIITNIFPHVFKHLNGTFKKMSLIYFIYTHFYLR